MALAKPKLNASVKNQAKARVAIAFKGDRERFKSRMKSDFRGTGISDAECQEICVKFADYAEIVENWTIHGGSKLKSTIALGEHAKLDGKLRCQYGELLRSQVENKAGIYCHDKLLGQRSTGQRASALVPFMLARDNNGIAFAGQPEDDLGNKAIHVEVAGAIVHKKPHAQFISAARNANIPAPGNSGRVLADGFQEAKIDAAQGKDRKAAMSPRLRQRTGAPKPPMRSATRAHGGVQLGTLEAGQAEPLSF